MISPFIGVLAIVLMVFFIFLGMPIGFSMAIVGFVGLVHTLGLSAALAQISNKFYSIISNYNYTVIPLFIAMGHFANSSGIASKAFLVAEKWLSRLPGGLGIAAIASCAAFASVCGSSVATAATLGAVCLPEMKKRNYRDDFATGIVAAGGTLGFLIPPSTAFVIYGIITEQSVGHLLMAGILPGILLASTFIALIIIRVKLNPALAPRVETRVSWKERLISLKELWQIASVFFLVMGGLYLGLFTSTECGAVGCFVLLIFTLAKTRFHFGPVFKGLFATLNVTCMIFVIVFGALIFADLLALCQFPIMLMDAITAMGLPRFGNLALIIAVYLLLGCFIESIPMIILTMPSILPVIKSLGFSPIWFGVLAVLMVEAAMITPPVGMNLYVITGVAKNVPMMQVARGATPFVISIVVAVILLTIFPQIALFLPDQMSK